tara:strand:+ start:1015 stop:1416 length:402 start_codon:yes stop_codon:yes gene_type:complete
MKVCLQKKGGTIIVAKGNYKINGPISFVSNVNLHLEEGAKLFFDTNPKDYPIVLTSWEGTSLYNYIPMIYGNNVAITGKGIIEGYPNFKVENIYLDHIFIKPAKNSMKLTNSKNMTFNEVIIGEKQTVPSSVH